MILNYHFPNLNPSTREISLIAQVNVSSSGLCAKKRHYINEECYLYDYDLLIIINKKYHNKSSAKFWIFTDILIFNCKSSSSNSYLKLIFKNSNHLTTLLKVIFSKTQISIFHTLHYNVVMPKFICGI